MTDKVLATYEGQQEIAEAIRGINLEALTQKAVWVDSVADMRELDAPQGITVATRGYYEPNDGGNGFYYIRAKEVGAVDDGGSVIFLDNDNEAKLITNGTVCPEQFGAYGDGNSDNPHDDTLKLQKMFAFASVVEMKPNTSYLVDTVTNGYISVSSNTIVNGNNATIKENDHDTITDNKPMLRLDAVSNVSINSLNVVGYLASVTLTSVGGTSHGIQMLGCTNISIDSCSVSYVIGDGIYAGNYSAKSNGITIKNCKLHHCHRHGIANTYADNFIVEDTEIYAIYKLDGVDIESGVSGVYSSNVTLRNLYIHDFITTDYSTHLGIMCNDGVNITIENCNVFKISAKVSVNINNCVMDALSIIQSTGMTVSGSQIKQLTMTIDVGETVFTNCIIGSKTLGNTATVTFSSATGITNTTSDVTFKDCKLISKNYISGSAAFNVLFLFNVTILNFKLIGNYIELNNGLAFGALCSGEAIFANNTIKVNSSDGITDYSVINSTSTYGIKMIDNVVDLMSIASTTANGIFKLQTGINYAVGNTVLSQSALGGTYSGNLFRTYDGMTLYAINNNAPAYAKISGGTGTPTVYEANNVLSGDLQTA